MFLAALVFTAAFAWQASNALELATPQSISGTYAHETASFGPPALSYSVSGVLVLADPENACNPLRWTNASAPSPFAGALVLAMRGNCSFAAKVLNIQTAGAAAAIVGNFDFDSDALHQMGSLAPINVSIPAVFIATQDYITIVASAASPSDATTPLGSGRVSAVGESTSSGAADRNLASLRTAFYFILIILFAWLGVLAAYWLRRRCIESRSRDSRLERFAALPSHVYGEVSGGVDGDAVAGLPRLHNTECCICLEPFQHNSQVKILPCAHGFHDVCIEPWMQSHDACPVCRTSIREGEQ